MIRFGNIARRVRRPIASRMILDAQWSSDQAVVRFIKQTDPDANGRQTFTVLWWEGEHRRGQVFHASLAEHLRQARRDGARPEVVDAIGAKLRMAA